MGKRSRDKGARFERWWAKFLRETMGWEAKRTAPMQAGHAADFADVASSIPGTDIEIAWELSHGAAPSIYGKIKQIKAADTGTAIQAVLTKRNREEPIVSMRKDEWVAMVGLLIRGAE